jgi:hypothetical protein
MPLASVSAGKKNMKLNQVFIVVTQMVIPLLLSAASPTEVTLELGRHHKVVATEVRNSSGAIQESRYTVVGNGVHFQDANGDWVEAKPLVQDLGEAIVCTGASFRVILNANLNTYGAVDLETSDRKRMVSHPLGIGFYDPESGRSVLLAEIKDCRAELVSSNLVVYRNAFEGNGIAASVTYAYRRGRFSQDVTFERGLSVSPADFGLGPNSRLEVLTEFIESPTPIRTTWTMKRETDETKRLRMVEPDLVDEKLDYGDMAMILGRAFPSDSSKRSGIPVAKRLLNIDGRTVLSEAVEWRDVVEKFEELPKQAGSLSISNRQAALNRELPKRDFDAKELPAFERRLAATTASSKPRLAALQSSAVIPHGFVLDYEQVISVEEFTFESGQTYLVQDDVVVDGMAIFEAGTVIKYAPDASLYIAGSVYGPEGVVVLTAEDDHSVGAQIGSGTLAGTYADVALGLYYISSAYLGYLDIRFADTAVYCHGGSWVIYSSSFLNCNLGVFSSSATISFGPADLCNVTTWHDQDYYGSISPYQLTACLTDRDGDGLPEDWELEHFGRLDFGGTGDFDGDGLTHLQEYQLGYKPTEEDTDGNGITDAEEDPDGDALSNVREYIVGTSPTNPDTGSSGTSDAYKDVDTDGLTNLEEFILGKNPLMPNVASPNFSPVGNSYASAQNVTITCPTAGVTIRYTTDGSVPTTSSTSISSGNSVTISSSQTLKARAWKAGWLTSDTESQTYLIEDPASNEAPTTTISPSGSVNFLASDSIEILVEAEDADGTIAKVLLYRGNYKVAETTSSPLRYTVANVPSGTYTYTAKAIDDDGAVTVTSSATLTIAASGPVVSLVGAQPFYTASPGMLIARVTGVNPGALSTLTLNGNAIPKRTGEFTINVPLNEGENTFTLLANGTAEATTKVYLDSTAPVIAITAPANSSTFDTERINVSGTFTESSLKQITVNGVLAFTDGGNFEALNVPLADGENTITATAEDIAGNETTTSTTVNGSATPVDPAQLAASPVGGFVSLVVTFTPTASVPGTLQYVYYDFDGDGDSEQTETDLDPITHTYTGAREYFPVVTVQTTAGRFSSLGGWNSTTADRLRINVQVAPATDSTISVTDPIDFKTTANGHLYVLSRSTETITQYDASHAVVRTVADIGTTPTGLDVDANGNVYVALSGAHQIAKFNPDGSTFALDNTFGTAGLVGGSGSGDGEFNTPYDVAVSPDGAELSVSDSGNHRIQRFNAHDGTFLGAFGSSGSGAGQFNTPKGLTYDEVGHLYIVDSGNNRVVLAQSTGVVGTSGSAGTLLGQFQGAVNLGVGGRGIYVVDTGNTRIQVFDLIEGGHGSAPTPFATRLPITANQFSPALSQPSAVAQTTDFLEEKIYIADTGNNRVIKVSLPEASTPDTTWAAMKTHIINNGNLAEAAAQFSSGARDDYLRAFHTIGLTKLTADINAMGTLTPVYIEGDQAQYYFEQTIEGQLLLFPVDFVKENGVWKILEF